MASNHTVHTLLHDSETLKRKNKRLIALVPAVAAERPVPVCYYLHGWGGTAEAYLNHQRILQILGDAPQVSVFPESFRNWFINDHQGNRYEDYLITEAIPAAEKAWLPHGCGSRRMISGFSMGGLSALCMMWRHPQLFAGLACFAGAFEAPQRTGDPYAQFRDRDDLLIPTERDLVRTWGEPGSAVRRQYDPYESFPPSALIGKRVYLSIGTHDFERMITMNQRFSALLEGARIPHLYQQYPHGHDMDLVAASLRPALHHLLHAPAEAAA
jgi:putative tributyrin esterase